MFADYRKHAAKLIIIPCLVFCRGMTDRNEIHDVVMNWANRCAELRRLDPSGRDFSRVRSRIDEAMRFRIPPMTSDTLKEKNRELCEALEVQSLDWVKVDKQKIDREIRDRQAKTQKRRVGVKHVVQPNRLARTAMP